MKQKDNIDYLFERMQGSFDVHQTPEGHQKRFLERLNVAQETPKAATLDWWKPFSIAASIALLLTVGWLWNTNEDTVQDLASVSPEMEQTQSFFVTAINQEVETLKSFQNEDTQVLIDDTMKRLNHLELEYNNLVIDLKESGNDKRVIAAMIANFQSRIELLQQVIETIEEIKTLKANRNETIL